MVLLVLAAVAVPVGIVLALFVAPVEAVQGEPYRILYVHVPSVTAAYLAFTVTFVASVVYLLTRRIRVDRLAAVSAEIGQVFLTIVLLTGPIWGKPVWGVWWTWDARLTTALVLWFIFAGYLMLRAWAGPQGARAAAVVAIAGFLDIPLIHWSAVLLRTLHPPPTVFRPEGPALPPSMLVILSVNTAAFLLAYFAFLTVRMRQEALRDLQEAAP
ncbi:MAG: cytochrome c biogenesis protein CcsA [Armatimonadota bacterium]|nr:cytochrome c biogenesis protein CcsA [Armatimonadota bacterium]MDR7452352.1 cytochrome c biogenesis protein CcsA [Armatimonadota bacterium]MDR7466912.1 cytochrome c biogenesis protein CcsA [Armatimonadota bacterium]MDR7493546.1 cytochrome c biogenesis protein CcsA [Armatimonadota bacterium]MDR7498811.1 cytochrome c biogenesis protein CcsA [Armatimonadota bacterium]